MDCELNRDPGSLLRIYELAVLTDDSGWLLWHVRRPSAARIAQLLIALRRASTAYETRYSRAPRLGAR